MRVYFGRTATPNDLKKQIRPDFHMLEVTARPGQLPKRARLSELSSGAPEGFAFAVLAIPEVLGPEPARTLAVKAARETAEALKARFLVVRAPNTFRPGPTNERKLEQTLKELEGGDYRVAFEPTGLWQPNVVRNLTRKWGVQHVQGFEDLRAEPTLYVRLVPIGVGKSRLNNRLDELCATLIQCEEAFVVVEGPTAPRLQAAIRAELELLVDELSDSDEDDSDEDDSDEDDSDEDDSDEDDSDEDEPDLRDPDGFSDENAQDERESDESEDVESDDEPTNRDDRS